MRRIVSAFENEWTPDLLQEVYTGIEEIAVGEWGYNIFRNQIEIISDEGMLEAYATVGLPVMYHHWSFGKSFLAQSKLYKSGMMGLAYEIVINSDPCISYLMEGNSLTMQTLVMAHAAFGHNHFFKNNYLFKQWTRPDSIVDYLLYAKKYISQCEERYGIEAVEDILDASHALRNYSVDKYNRVRKTKTQLEEELRQRIEWEDKQFDPLSDPFREKKPHVDGVEKNKVEPTENLLYFIEKQAPNLEVWQREIVRIVRMIGQYFYPQRQLQVMNEGFATGSHYTILNEMEARGLLDEQFMLEFLHSHSGVVFQPAYNDQRYNGINPYALGFHLFMDMKRRAENPTKEDEELFPDQVGRPYRDVWFEGVESYKDESFIEQYLSPEVVRKMGLFSLFDTDKQNDLRVTGTANGEFPHLRRMLARQLDLGSLSPNISVFDVDWKGNRTLKLRHDMYNNRPLHEDESRKVLRMAHKLWQFPVSIESWDGENTKHPQSYP